MKRVMSWVVQTSESPEMYESFEVIDVTPEKITWHETVLNSDMEPFANSTAQEVTMPNISINKLLPGTTGKTRC